MSGMDLSMQMDLVCDRCGLLLSTRPVVEVALLGGVRLCRGPGGRGCGRPLRLAEWARERAGCRSLRVARSTDRLVGVYAGEEAGLDTDDGRAPYSTVCEVHGSVVCHPTLRLAEAHAADPAGWCESCRPLSETP